MLQSFRINDETLSNRLRNETVQTIIETVVKLSPDDAARVVRHFFGGSDIVDFRSFKAALQ